MASGNSKKPRFSHRAKSHRQNRKNNVTIRSAQKLTINSPGISTKSTLPPERLQKVLANVGVDSRRKIEQLITDGQVRVNGKVSGLGDKVVAGNIVNVGNIEVTIVEQNHPIPRVILYHKPEGEVCTRNDPEGRRTVFQSLPDLPNGRWVNVGRLDINTSGLLLFTDDGVLANRLMHPSAEIERHYAVRILGDVQKEHIDQLSTGVMLDDGMSNFLTFQDLGGEGANHWYRVSLKSGRFREVRRLWEALSFQVSRLIRIQFGEIILPQNLPSGSYQDLSEAAVKRMVEVIDMPTKSYTGLYGRGRRLRRNDNQQNNGYKQKSNHGRPNHSQGGHSNNGHSNDSYQGNRHSNNGNSNNGYKSKARGDHQGNNKGNGQGYNQDNRNNNGYRGKNGQQHRGQYAQANQGDGNYSQGQGYKKPGYKSGPNRNGSNPKHQNKGHKGNGYQGNGYQQNNYGRSYDDQSFLGNPEDLYGNGHPHKNVSTSSGNRGNGNAGNKPGGHRPKGAGGRSASANRNNPNGNRGQRNKY